MKAEGSFRSFIGNSSLALKICSLEMHLVHILFVNYDFALLFQCGWSWIVYPLLYHSQSSQFESERKPKNHLGGTSLQKTRLNFGKNYTRTKLIPNQLG